MTSPWKEIGVFIIVTSQVVIDEFLGHFFFIYKSIIFYCDILLKAEEINLFLFLSIYVGFLVLYLYNNVVLAMTMSSTLTTIWHSHY